MVGLFELRLLLLGHAAFHFGGSGTGGDRLGRFQVEILGHGHSRRGPDVLDKVLDLAVHQHGDVESPVHRQAVVAIMAFFIGLDCVVAFDIGAFDIDNGARQGFAVGIFDDALDGRRLCERGEGTGITSARPDKASDFNGKNIRKYLEEINTTV